MKMAFDTEHIIIKTPSFLRGSFRSLPASSESRNAPSVERKGTSRKPGESASSSRVRFFVSP
jgi:hypothetical protein